MQYPVHSQMGWTRCVDNVEALSCTDTREINVTGFEPFLALPSTRIFRASIVLFMIN